MVARISKLRSSPGGKVTGRQPRSTEGSEHLHDEDRFAVLLEGGTQLARERFHHVLVAAENLRAHVVRDDLETAVGVEAIDEAPDRGYEVVAQWIETDLDANVHRFSINGRCTRPSLPPGADHRPGCNASG